MLPLNNDAPKGMPPCKCGHEYEDHWEASWDDAPDIVYDDRGCCVCKRCFEYREFDPEQEAYDAATRRWEGREGR